MVHVYRQPSKYEYHIQNHSDLKMPLGRNLWLLMGLMVAYGATRIHYEIRAFKIWVTLTLTFRVTQGQMWWLNWMSNMSSYWMLIEAICLSPFGCSISLVTWPKFRTPLYPPLPPGPLFSNSVHFLPVSEQCFNSTKSEVDWDTFLRHFVDPQTHVVITRNPA